MALGLFDSGRRRRRGAVEALYSALMTLSRRPELYREMAIPDTLDGRFDALVLHMVLLLRRLNREGETTAGLRQDLFDHMFTDLDRGLREAGVGDHSIGRRVKQMISAFYGRARAYEAALDGAEGDLEAALARNIHRGIEVGDAKLAQLAAHARAVVEMLDAQPAESLLRGDVRFPEIVVAPPEER